MILNRLSTLNKLIEKKYNKPIKNHKEIKLIKKLIKDENKSIERKFIFHSNNADTINFKKKRIEKAIVHNIVKIETGKFYVEF